MKLPNRLSKQVLCWVCTAWYAAVDAGGMMSGHWFPPHVPCFTAHLVYAVRAQHGGIAGLGDCSILCLAESPLKACLKYPSDDENKC